MNGLSRDDIIRMAREADLPPCHTTHPKALERFAHLVAAAEREAIAEWYENRGWMLDDGLVPDAIRARRET